MGELNPTTTVALFAMLGLVLAAAVGAVPGILAIFVTDRRAAARDAAAAVLVAKVAEKAEKVATKTEEVAVKTEEVKTHLAQSDAQTSVKLDSIECKADQIHDLVNNKYSEVLKTVAMLADMLVAEKPDNLKYQEIAEQAAAGVKAHQPAESTTREANGPPSSSR
jgi:hypothetical protein